MKEHDYEKFHAQDEEKQERIINAAMKEFLSGFKAAATDTIVREAGISKGLLFHYFGTKENLYNYLISHAVKTIKTEFLSLINSHQPDILDTIWQMALLKRDVSHKYPAMFDFLTVAYLDMKNTGENEALLEFISLRENILTEAYIGADKSLFRDDVDSQDAINIINWATEGYAKSKVRDIDGINPGEKTRENYEDYLAEFEKIVKILKKCFYKEGVK